MEFNATDSFIFAILSLNIISSRHTCGIHLTGLGSLCITEHIEVVLEDIDDLIGTEGVFNSLLDLQDELLKFILLVLLFLSGCIIFGFFCLFDLNTRWRSDSNLLILSNITHEVLGLILNSLIDHSSMISLSLDTLDLECGLETHIQNFFVVLRQVHETFEVGLDVLWVHILGISLNKSSVTAEIFSRSGDAHSNEGSLILYDTVFDRL